MVGLDRITFDPDVMRGRACIRGMRVTVSLILNMVANGMSAEEIIEAYPYIEPEDIKQSLQYAAWKSDDSVNRDAKMVESINIICSEVDTSLDPAISAMQRTWLSKEDW